MARRISKLWRASSPSPSTLLHTFQTNSTVSRRFIFGGSSGAEAATAFRGKPKAALVFGGVASTVVLVSFCCTDRCIHLRLFGMRGERQAAINSLYPPGPHQSRNKRIVCTQILHRNPPQLQKRKRASYLMKRFNATTLLQAVGSSLTAMYTM